MPEPKSKKDDVKLTLTPPAPPAPSPAAAGGQPEIVVREDDAHAAYANFARVTGTPEEVIVDFAQWERTIDLEPLQSPPKTGSAASAEERLQAS